MPDERDLVKFCKLAEELGAGVQLRHSASRLAYLTGRYADLGVLAVMVPLVEEVETANEAIENFYYPPLGNRSWGGEFRFGEKPPTDRLKYAQWWNGNGLLGFQIETLRGALNARNIVKPGVDWISWGPGDMAFDIERHSNSPFKGIEEAHAYVISQLKGYDVQLPALASSLKLKREGRRGGLLKADLHGFEKASYVRSMTKKRIAAATTRNISVPCSLL